jgi:hypothetical protein
MCPQPRKQWTSEELEARFADVEPPPLNWRKDGLWLGCMILGSLLLVLCAWLVYKNPEAWNHGLGERDQRVTARVAEIQNNSPVLVYEIDGTAYRLANATNRAGRKFQVGDPVSVAYRKDQPADAVIEEIAQEYDAVWIMPIGLLILLLGVAILVFQTTRSRPRANAPAPGG